MNMNTEKVISTNNGMSTFESFADKNLIEFVKSQESWDFLFWNYDQSAESSLAFVLPTETREGVNDGYLVVLVDKTKLQENLIMQNDNEEMDSVIVNERKEVILGSTSEEIQNFITSSDAGGNENISSKFLISSSVIQPENWEIYYIVSVKNLLNQVNALLIRLIILIVGLLLVIATVLLLKLKNIILPFDKLAQNIQIKLQNAGMGKGVREKSHVEYKMIKNGVDFLMGSVEKLNVSMRNYKGIIQEGILNKWILHGKLSEDVKEYLSTNKNLLSFEHIQLAVVRIESYQQFTEKYDYYAIKALKFGIGNILEEVLSNEGWTSLGSDLGGDHIVIIIGSTGQPLAKVSEVLGHAKLQIHKYIKIKTNVSVSKVVRLDGDINETYNKMYALNKMKFMYNEEIVYCETDFEKYNNIPGKIEVESLVNEIREMIYLGKEDRVGTALEKLENSLMLTSYTECKYQLMFYIYKILNHFIEHTSVQSFEEIERKLERFSTLRETFEWLNEELVGIMERIKITPVRRKKEDIALQMKDYVSEHLSDVGLTVEQISENLSFSPGYIRLVFKEIYNISLSQYIVNERIHYVKHLIDTTDWTVLDIMHKSGFVSKSNFFTTFKRLTGMTPNQYRESDKESD